MVHSHDGIDWDARIQRLREGDALSAPETTELARRVIRASDQHVVEVGAGAGGTAAALVSALGTGSVTLVDSAPELLAAAAHHAASGSGSVEIREVQADLASDDWLASVEPADVVFAAFVVHHLPDQAAGLRRLSTLLRPGGRLIVVEAGLEQRVLPWDVGLGEPGLEARLEAARAEWFRELRATMPGSVRLTVGWDRALSEAGLSAVHSWTYLIDRRPPASELVRGAAIRRLERLRDSALDRLGPDDIRAVDALLDPGNPRGIAQRDDIYYLTANAVYVGTRPMSTMD